MKSLPLITFLCASSSMVYQFSLAQYASAIFGGVSLFYTITVGIYTFALGVGSLFFKKINLNFILIEILLIFFGGILPIILYFNKIESLHLFITIMFTVGFLSGLEIPTIMQINGSDYDNKLWYIDLFGSAFGVLFFVVYLQFSLHLISLIFVNALINLIPLTLYLKASLPKNNLFIK